MEGAASTREDCTSAGLVDESEELRALPAEVERAVNGHGEADVLPADDAEAARVALQRLVAIVRRYAEASHLLDSFLEGLIAPLARCAALCAEKVLRLAEEGHALDSLSWLSILQTCSKVLLALCTQRGVRVTSKFFPVSAHYFELIVGCLCRITRGASAGRIGSALDDGEGGGVWEVQYVLLVWLASLALVPFDVYVLDSSVVGRGVGSEGEWKCAPLAARLLDVCTEVFLMDSGPVRERAATVVGQLLSRHDMKESRELFEGWAHDIMAREGDPASASASASAAGVQHFGVVGAAAAVAAILKHTQRRSEGMGNAQRMLLAAEKLQASELASKNILLRKLAVKIAGRACTSMLPPRVASWRYQRGQRSLLDSAGPEAPAAPSASDVDDDDSRDEAVLAAALAHVVAPVETGVEMLLCGLRDADTIVRWSAAKGIGRVTMRLPLLLADDVVTATLSMCDPLEGDGAWHGGCLALAELAQRGLLLPEKLKYALPVATSALAYDVRRGEHSVGAHVRDAGAYLCWSFSRAYSPEILSDGGGVMDLARSLVVTACYDREVNCRRAAAAALQEMIGRLGIGCGKDELSVAHGLELLTEANYFTLGTRRSAYLQVAKAIAQYKEYRGAMVHHLLHSKLVHWERGLRELAAEALGALVSAEPALILRELLGLVARATDKELAVRHGATHAVAEVLVALYAAGATISEEQRNAVAGLVPRIEKARLYRGRGGEIMRSAVCHLIKSISICRLRLASSTTKLLLSSVDEHLRHPTAEIQKCAVAALGEFTRAYCVDAAVETAPCGEVRPPSLSLESGQPLAARYSTQAEANQNVAVRRGSAMAAGALPAPLLLEGDLPSTLSRLRNATKEEADKELRDPETRVNALEATADIMEACASLRPSRIGDDAYTELLRGALATALEAFEDYAIDNRGDVGSWVREAAMRVSVRLIKVALETDARLLTEDAPGCGDRPRSVSTTLVASIVKQAAEKIDRVRATAGDAMASILHRVGDVPGIESVAILRDTFPDSGDVNWSAPSESFDRIINLLPADVYRPYVVSGVLISVGAVGNSLVKSSGGILLRHLTGNDDRVYEFVETAVSIIAASSHNNRIVVPALKTLDMVLTGVGSASVTALFDPSKPVGGLLLDATRAEVKGCRDVPKLCAAIDIFSHLSATYGTKDRTDPDVQEGSLRQMLLLLINRYPRVRQYASDQLYLRLLQPEFEEVCDDVDAVIEILETTDWSSPAADELKSARLRMFAPLGLQPPQTSQKSGQKERKVGAQASDENASYQSLVNSAGY